MTASTKLAPAPADPPAAPPVVDPSVPLANSAGDAAVPSPTPAGAAAARPAAVAVPPAELAWDPADPLAGVPCPERFGYVIDSAPVALAANMERAVQAIAAEPGGLGSEESALAARDLCYALERFVAPEATAEQVAAFLGAFRALLPFLREADEPPLAPGTTLGTTGLGEVKGSPAARLCWVLFWVHKVSRVKRGGCADRELLEHLELALESFDDAEGACWGKGAVLGVMARYASRLFEIDPAWTQERLFAHLAPGDAYRQATARLLIHFGSSGTDAFSAGVRPYVLGFFDDIEAVFDNRGDRTVACRWVYWLAEQALAERDEAAIAEIAGVLRVMRDTERGKFIHALCRPFDDLTGYYEELSDRQLFEVLDGRLRTPQLIRTFWPTEPQYQSEWTTKCFINLIFDAGEHAGDIYEVCRDFLVPLADEGYQYQVYYKLVRKPRYRDFVQANPAIMAGIIDRTTNEHSSYLTELAELKTHLISKTPPPPAAAS